MIKLISSISSLIITFPKCHSDICIEVALRLNDKSREDVQDGGRGEPCRLCSFMLCLNRSPCSIIYCPGDFGRVIILRPSISSPIRIMSHTTAVKSIVSGARMPKHES